MLVKECHLEFVLWHIWVLREVKTSKAYLFAIDLLRILKVDVFNRRLAVPAICSCCDIIITVHFALFTFAATTWATLGTIAMPFSTATHDLNVQIRSRFPLKNHIHTSRRESQAFITNRSKQLLNVAQICIGLWPARIIIWFRSAKVLHKHLFTLDHLVTSFEGHRSMIGRFMPNIALETVVSVHASCSTEEADRQAA